MNKYVVLPRKAIAERLEAAGFAPHTNRRGELVYVRAHDRDARITVKVYTTVPLTAQQGRAKGSDAIRVVAIFQWWKNGEQRTKNLYKAKVLRVNSVEGILDRTVERAREAYKAANVFLRQSRERVSQAKQAGAPGGDA